MSNNSNIHLVRNTGRTRFKPGNKTNLGRVQTEDAKKKIGTANGGRKFNPRSQESREKSRLASIKVYLEGRNPGASHRWAGHIKAEKPVRTKRERVRSVSGVSHTEYMRFWREANREIDRQMKHKRKMLLKKLNSCHSMEEWLALKEWYKNTCPACGRSEPTIRLTRDHVIPLTSDGGDNIENIQPLCASCNTRKYTKAMFYLPTGREWGNARPNYGWKGGLNKEIWQ